MAEPDDVVDVVDVDELLDVKVTEDSGLVVGVAELEVRVERVEDSVETELVVVSVAVVNEMEV